MIRKSLVVALSATAALAPAASAVEPSGTDQKNAAKECKAERGTTDATREAFNVKYGSNENDSNAFGKCVSQKTREEASERRAAKRAAQRQCKAQGLHGKSRARCVSRKAKQLKAKEDREDATEAAKRQNAAKKCAAERGTTTESRAAFEQKYGTNKNKRNAFGKCVSQTARSS